MLYPLSYRSLAFGAKQKERGIKTCHRTALDGPHQRMHVARNALATRSPPPLCLLELGLAGR